MIFGDLSANLLEAFRNALPEPVDFDVLGDEAANAVTERLKPPNAIIVEGIHKNMDQYLHQPEDQPSQIANSGEHPPSSQKGGHCQRCQYSKQ